jgi:hypothetical protein
MWRRYNLSAPLEGLERATESSQWVCIVAHIQTRDPVHTAWPNSCFVTPRNRWTQWASLLLQMVSNGIVTHHLPLSGSQTWTLLWTSLQCYEPLSWVGRQMLGPVLRLRISSVASRHQTLSQIAIIHKHMGRTELKTEAEQGSVWLNTCGNLPWEPPTGYPNRYRGNQIPDRHRVRLLCFSFQDKTW